MYLHGVDPLQFTSPVLCLVFWDIWTDRMDGRKASKMRNVIVVVRKCVEESARESYKRQKVEKMQTWDGRMGGINEKVFMKMEGK